MTLNVKARYSANLASPTGLAIDSPTTLEAGIHSLDLSLDERMTSSV